MDRPLEIDHAVSIVGISTASPSPLASVRNKTTPNLRNQSNNWRVNGAQWFVIFMRLGRLKNTAAFKDNHPQLTTVARNVSWLSTHVGPSGS